MKTIVIDVDGPLLEGRKKHYACYRFIAAQLGFEPIDEATYWKKKRDRTTPREILALSGAESKIESYKKSWFNLIETNDFLALDQLQKSVQIQLKSWSSLGFRLAATSMRQNLRKLETQLESFGISGYFPAISVTEFNLGGKGKAASLSEKILLPPQDTLWIGDTEADIDAARFIQCPIWALTCGLRNEDFLRQRKPDFLAETIGEVDTEKVWGSK